MQDDICMAEKVALHLREVETVISSGLRLHKILPTSVNIVTDFQVEG